MANRRIGTESLRAETMTRIALEPGFYTSGGLAEEMGVETLRADLVRASVWYQEIGWLTVGPPAVLPDPSSAKFSRRKHFHVTTDFWDVFHDAAASIAALPGNSRRLHDEAVEQRIQMEESRPGSFDRDVAEANFRGRVALLGERHDLARQYGWFKGVPGWSSLVSLEALGPEASAADQARPA